MPANPVLPVGGGVPPLLREQAEIFLAQAPDWQLSDEAHHIERSFRFRNFREALTFVSKRAQGHRHPHQRHGIDCRQHFWQFGRLSQLEGRGEHGDAKPGDRSESVWRSPSSSSRETAPRFHSRARYFPDAYYTDAYYTLIEPQDQLRAHVADLLTRNSRIRWVGVGASDTSGTLPFTMFSRDDRSSFTPTPEAAKANGMRQVEVPVTTLNEVARTGNAPCPDIVKIDAEGFDLRVVAGASELVVRPTSFCSRRQSVET